VVLVGQSAVDLSDIRSFRGLFGRRPATRSCACARRKRTPGLSGGESGGGRTWIWNGRERRRKNASLILRIIRNVMDRYRYAVRRIWRRLIGMTMAAANRGRAPQRPIAQQANAQGITGLRRAIPEPGLQSLQTATRW